MINVAAYQHSGGMVQSTIDYLQLRTRITLKSAIIVGHPTGAELPGFSGLTQETASRPPPLQAVRSLLAGWCFGIVPSAQLLVQVRLKSRRTVTDRHTSAI